MAEAVVGAAATMGAAYLKSRSDSKATSAQQQENERAAEAARQREAEERRRYQERWDDYQRRYADWERRRQEAQGGGKTAGYIPGRSAARRPPTQGNADPSFSNTSTFGMNPVTGMPRSLADIAMKWNDWSEYGLQ